MSLDDDAPMLDDEPMLDDIELRPRRPSTLRMALSRSPPWVEERYARATERIMKSAAQMAVIFCRMFVGPALAASRDYERFWQDRAAGKPQAAEFKRLGKGEYEKMY